MTEAYDQLRSIADDLKSLMAFWSAWIEGEAGWKELAEWTRQRGRVAAIPYIRSVQQVRKPSLDSQRKR